MLPIICIGLPGTRDIRFFQTKLFFTFICALSITFATKFYFPSERTYHTNFRQDTTKNGLFRGNFCLCVENVMHVLDTFFSDQAMVLEGSSHIRYRYSHIWPNRLCI